MEPVDNDEMQPYTEIPPVSTTTPASLAGVYRGGPTSSIQEAVEVGKTLHRTVPSSLGFPHDTQTLIALGRMTYEQRLEFQFRETKEAKLAYLAEIMKVQPEVQAEARMVVSGLDSNVDALRSLQRFHPLVRCAYLGWVELDKINTVADLMRVYTALMQDKVDPKQWRSAHLKFDQLQAEYNRFMSSTSIAEQNRATVEASLKEQVAVKKHYFPQALWWNRFYDCDGFTADPVKSTFSIGGSEYGVDSFDRVEDRDFDRLVTTLRYFNRGEIVPVRMSVADCIAVGYLTMEYTPEVNVQRVMLRPSMSSATNSPLFRPESTAIRQRIEDVFKACVADIGLVPNVSIKTEWSFYVAYIYAYALATGQLAPLDSNTTFYADVAEWPNHIKRVTDFVENRCKGIWGECNSGGGRAWSAMGNTALYKDQYWVSLSHAFSGTQQRRSRVNVRSQTLTRMMDICKGSFGHPHLDGLTELKYLISRLGPAYVTGGIDVIFPADADFDVKSFRAMFDPQISIRFYHTKKDVGKKGDIEVLPFNDEVGPPVTGTLIVDLGIGRGAASDVQGKKSIWLSRWPAVVSCYMPTATFTTSVRTNDGSTQLPANLRYFHEHYKEVYFFSSLRWHQPQFYVVARAHASQPSWTPIGGDLEQGFRQGPFAKWVNFVVARSALSQIGNTWVAACDGLGVRMAPTFSAAMYMAGRIPDFSKGYAVKHGDKTLAGFYGGQQVAVVDEKIKAVPVDAYEATQDDFRPDGGDLLFADDRVSAIPMEPGTVEVIQPGETQQPARVEEADGRKGKSKQRRTSEKGGQKQGRGKSTRSALPAVAQTAILPYDASSQATQGITTLRLHDVGEEQLPDAPPVTGHSGVGGVTFNL